METGLFSPMIADTVLILVGVISLVALVGISYNYSLMFNARGKIAKIEALEQELKILQRELKELKSQMVKYQFKEAAPIDKGVPKSAVNTAAAGAAESPLKRLAGMKITTAATPVATATATMTGTTVLIARLTKTRSIDILAELL